MRETGSALAIVRGVGVAAAMAGTVLAAGAARAQTPSAAVATLHRILKDYDAFWNQNDPFGAGQRGDLAAMALWPDDSAAAEADRHRMEREFKERLDAVPAAALSGEDALNRQLLEYQLAIDI